MEVGRFTSSGSLIQPASTRVQPCTLHPFNQPLLHTYNAHSLPPRLRNLSTYAGATTRASDSCYRVSTADASNTKERLASLEEIVAPSLQRNQRATAPAISIETRSCSWSVKDDETLIQARAQGLKWNQIAPKHFPTKSANACRKRHERLMERRNAEKLDENKLDIVSQAYMEVRREMWSILAAKVGEKWPLVEQKCMETGIKNIVQAARSLKRKTKDSSFHQSDSGISMPIFRLGGEAIPVDSGHESPQQRVPSTQSMLTWNPTDVVSYQQNKLTPPTRSMSSPRSNSDQLASQPGYPQRSPTKLSNDQNKEDMCHDSHAELDAGATELLHLKTSSGSDRVTATAVQSSTSDHEEIPMCSTALAATDVVIDAVPSRSGSRNASYDLTTRPSLETSSGSNSPEDEAVDMTEESIQDASLDCAHDIDAQKEEILDRLMVYFYEIFTSSRLTQHGRNESSSPANSSEKRIHTTSKSSKSSSKKRKSNERGEEADPNDEDEDGDKRSKRPKSTKHAPDFVPEIEKRLACPYYKRDAQNCQSSRACAGPGWLTVHRLKEHLYREHAMPLHCRRCYIIFDNESQLTDHSRSSDGCEMKESRPLDGFDKDQEKKLKSRRSMFRADSEEQKWKIVYLILFPNTAPNELPSPYYEDGDSRSPEVPIDPSPKAPELKQFDAFMNRELPRKVRKAFEAAIEGMIGPIEETLKNELENIVRDCQEALTRSFLESTQNLVPSSAGPSGRIGTSRLDQHTPSIDLTEHESFPAPATMSDELSRYYVPPDSAAIAWPDTINMVCDEQLLPAWSDSAYYSQSSNFNFSLLTEPWDAPGSYPATTTVNDQANANESAAENSGPYVYVGKGKGKARGSKPYIEHGT